MNETPDNVVSINRSSRGPGGNGNGNGNSARFAAIESRLTDVESRLTAVETHLKYLATKEDIQTLHTTIEQAKNSMLRWGIGVFGSALASVLFMAFRMSGG